MPGRSGESILVGLGRRRASRRRRRRRLRGPVRSASASAVDRAQLADEARSLALEPVPLDRIQGAIGEALDRVFGLFDVLSLIAVIVASLGIVNTLTMNVLERVREIGVLRAAGMTRRQVWRSVVVEAGITGLAGAICGVVAGVRRRWAHGRAVGRSPRSAVGDRLAARSPWRSCSASPSRCLPLPIRRGWRAASRSSGPSATSRHRARPRRDESGC